MPQLFEIIGALLIWTFHAEELRSFSQIGSFLEGLIRQLPYVWSMMSYSSHVCPLSLRCSMRNTCTWTMRSGTSWTAGPTLTSGTRRKDGSESLWVKETWSPCQPASTTASPWTRLYVWHFHYTRVGRQIDSEY